MVERWLPLLQDAAAPFEGVAIEDKIFSVAVHFRRAEEKQAARAAILRAARELQYSRIAEGKMVINVLPEGAPHKGVALERERQELGCERAMYVGDEEADEDVFATGGAASLLSIRVGEDQTSRAAYFVQDQDAVDDLLELLVSCRTSAVGQGTESDVV
jgi:trehalose 6-phosphate phosphatase